MYPQQIPDTLSSVCPLERIPDGYPSVRAEDRVAVNAMLLKLAKLKPSWINEIQGMRIEADDTRACLIITVAGCTVPIDTSTFEELEQMETFSDAYVSMKEQTATLTVEMYTARNPNHGKRDLPTPSSAARIMDTAAVRNAAALQRVIEQAESVARK
jgi:hypothetical protein